MPECQLERIPAFLCARGNVQAEDSRIHYATEQSPLPIQLTPGITEDADPSTTPNEDIKVVEKNGRNNYSG